MKTEMKSLADELRQSIGGGEVSLSNKDPVKDEGRKSAGSEKLAGKNCDKEKNLEKEKHLEIISRMRDFDVSQHRHLLHPRLDQRTILLLNRLKLVSGLDMNRVIAFSIAYLFEQHPEIKTFVKHSLENFE